MLNLFHFGTCWAGGAGIWRSGGGLIYTIAMSDIDSLIKRGEAFYSEGLYDSAISNYTKAITEGDRSSQLFCLRAKAYLAKAWEAAGQSPFDEEEYDVWAADFCRRPDLQLALVDAVQAATLDPENSEAHYGLGVIQIDRQCWPEAIAAFDRCLELLPGDSEAMYWRAVAYDEMGDTAKALETMGDVIKADPECSEAYYMRSQIRTAAGNLEAALEDISKAIDLDPEAPEYYLQRGKVLSYLSEKPHGAARLPEAISDLSEVLRLDPKCAEAYSWRALAYMQAGEEKKELKDLDRLLELAPHHAEGYRLRYECQAACGRRLEAAVDWLYLCFLKPRAINDTMIEAGRGARADFKKLSGN